MKRAIDIAISAWPACRPNPMVGAVLVYNGQVLSEGFTSEYGGPHAEVNCLRDLEGDARLAESVLYVSLEPCCHTGNTPPCTDLILRSGIKRVVIGARDPNPLVDGGGIGILKNAGIDVVTGILEDECREVNKHFFCQHEKRRPYIMLKWAESADGFIDRHRDLGDRPAKLTDSLTDQESHQARSHFDAILVGGVTYRMDSPRLNVRHVHGPDPKKIVWTKDKVDDGFIAVDASGPEEMLDKLYAMGIQSVLVEGGARTLQQFIDSGHYDEIRNLKSEIRLGAGVKSPDNSAS